MDWITKFLSARENKIFLAVDIDFFLNPFNLFGIKEFVPYYEFALQLIVGKHVDEIKANPEYQEIKKSQIRQQPTKQ